MQLCCPLFLKKVKVNPVKVDFETSKVASWGDEGLEKLKRGWPKVVAHSGYCKGQVMVHCCNYA